MKKNSTSDRKKSKRNSRAKNSVFWTVVVVLMAAGIYLIARPHYDRWQRNHLTEQLNASYISYHEKQVNAAPSSPPSGTVADKNTDIHTDNAPSGTAGGTLPGEDASSTSADTSGPDGGTQQDTQTGSHTAASEEPLPGETDISNSDPDSGPSGSGHPASGSPVSEDPLSEAPEGNNDSAAYPTFIVDPEAHALPSEQEVWIRDTEVFQRDVALQADGNVTLTVIGQMSIPKIDLLMPVLDNALAITIRYGLGRYPDARSFGEYGNAVVFGHRMRNYGEHFNRVNELVPGDQIEVFHDGQIYRYEVTGNKIVEIENVYDEILGHPEDLSQLILATCHPIPTFEDYLLVYAELIEIR